MTVLPVLLLSLLTPMQESQVDFEKRLDRVFADSGVPGGGVRVARDGKVLFERAFGVADVVGQAATKTWSAFEIGSLSKMFTATCALMLVQEGKLALDEKLGTILPEVPASWKGATVDQILHHMSGIPDYEEIAGYDFYNSPREPKEVLEQAAKKEPAFPPGGKYEYSNTGYFLISMIVEKRSGVPLGQFLKQRIFDPLRMTSTYADVKSAQAEPMTGYHSRTGARMKQPPIAWTSTLGAGGIVSTMDDLMKWDEALYTDKLVKQDLLSKIWTPTKLNDGRPNTYGYGWVSTAFRGMKELNHSGQTNGFTCVVQRYPDRHLTVWSFCNTYGGGVVFRLSRASLIRYFPEVSYSKFPVATDSDPERTKRHLALLRKAVFSEGGYDGMTPNIKDFATAERFADTRKELQSYLGKSPELRFMRTTTRRNAAGSLVNDYLYRQALPTGYKYWTVGFTDGLLSTILVEDE